MDSMACLPETVTSTLYKTLDSRDGLASADLLLITHNNGQRLRT
jgi:hypothetical protein